ncbi:MAG: 3-oxoacyl-[acyl-carrier-protein] synthase III C-terminal domain-containing protein [bacterium]
MRVGIVSHGAYVPPNRLELVEIKKFWGSLSTPAINMKSFPGYDEDIVTMAVEAARQALERAGMQAEQMGAVFLATTSGPYEEKPNVSSLVSALSGNPRLRAVELGGSPRAGTLALLAGIEFSSCWVKPCLVVASDAPLAHPSSSLEHGFGAAAVAFVIAPDERATFMEGVESLSIETFGERFRRRGERFVQDLELRQDELTESVLEGVRGLLERLGFSAHEFHSMVLPDSDGITAQRLAGRLGVDKGKILSVTQRLGDTGTAAVLLGMVQALESLDSGQRILVASYGSGVDVMSWVLGQAIEGTKGKGPVLEEMLRGGRQRSYADYLKMRGFLSFRPYA